MKNLVMPLLVAGLAAAAVAVVAAPALAQEAKKTELVELGGKQVDSLLLRYGFVAVWAVDDQHILMRDAYREHYVVTLKAPCQKLDMHRSIKFVPALAGRIRSSLTYEARDVAGQPCDVSKVEQVDAAEAARLRAAVADGGAAKAG